MQIALMVMAVMLVQPLVFSSTAQQAAGTKAPALDFDYFKTKVQPIFLTKRPGFTRCVSCHSEGGNVGYLQKLAPGATAWTDEQARKNFESVSRLVVAGQPTKSRLLMHPLKPTAGGDEFHNGGWQFDSQTDPLFLTLAAWTLGETAGSTR